MMVYKAWCEEAGYRLNGTRHNGSIPGPYALTIHLPGNTRMDPDNAVKAINDLLRNHGLIVDDGPRYQRRLLVEFDLSLPDSTCRVTLAEYRSEA